MKLNKIKSWFKWSRDILSQRWNTVWIVISSSRLSKKSFTRFTNHESYVLLLIKIRYNNYKSGRLWQFGPGSSEVRTVRVVWEGGDSTFVKDLKVLKSYLHVEWSNIWVHKYTSAAVQIIQVPIRYLKLQKRK